VKKIIYFALICVCAYAILAYALDNPRGAERLREDIEEVTAKAAVAGVEAAESAREYVSKATD